MTKNLKKDLQSMSKALYAIAQKLEKMYKEINKQEKSTKSPKAKAVKKVPTKKVVIRRTAPPTSADKIFAIIKRSKKGVKTADLIKKTGYERKAISNAIYKLTKQGKIKTATKGVYVKV
jgi:predicted Rossmann fold nucleotide-binding protein DprA/Smf involved in DNA uptake